MLVNGLMATTSSNSFISTLLKANQAPKVLCLLARDKARKDQVVAALKERFDLTPTQVQGKKIDKKVLAEVADQLNALSLFSSSSSVCIDGFEDIKAAHVPRLIEIMKACHEGSTLLFLGTKKPRSKKLYDAVTALGQLHQFPTFFDSSKDSARAYKNWFTAECKRQGIAKHPNNLSDLVADAAEHDLDRVVSMIQQLSLYCERITVTEDDFYALFTTTQSAHVFDFTNALLEGRRAQAESLLCILGTSKDTCFQLLGLLARNYSKLLILKDMERRKLPRDTIKAELKLYSEPIYRR